MRGLIITHPGSAHFDECLAVSLILAVHKDTDFSIERRNPTAEELDNPAVWVVDVGGRHEPSLKNFDHHQDINLNASFVLVATYLKLDHKLGQMPWWNFKDKVDRFGPFKVARELGLPNLLSNHSPLETWFLDMFAQDPTNLRDLLRSFGQSLIDEADHLLAQFEFWKTCDTVMVGDKVVLVGLTNDSTGVQRYCAQMEPPAAISVTYDGRSSGWRLARVNDAKGVDFSRLDGNPHVRFAHKSGFMAKTNERLPLDDILKLVSLAIE